MVFGSESIKCPISLPVSSSKCVKCYPCREVPLNYSDSLLFHGGDTGSTPVRDANNFSIFAISTDIKQTFLNGPFHKSLSFQPVKPFHLTQRVRAEQEQSVCSKPSSHSPKRCHSPLTHRVIKSSTFVLMDPTSQSIIGGSASQTSRAYVVWFLLSLGGG